MRILGLDPGGTTGFAYGIPGHAPKSGSIRLDSKHGNSRRYCTLEGRIRNIIAVHDVDAVFIEGPFVPMDTHDKEGKRKPRFNPDVVILAYGYQAAILMACEKEGIGPERIHIVPPSTWRSRVLKRTMAPKGTENSREWLKLEAIKACDARGWPISSQDEAEACLIWEHGCEEMEPSPTLNRTPPFAQLSV